MLIQHLRCHDVPPLDLYDYLLQFQVVLLELTLKLDHSHVFLSPRSRHVPDISSVQGSFIRMVECSLNRLGGKSGLQYQSRS
jgi:hypothetical protein